ncbi:unnamed protein product [Protopolystoma xenopodis]|uniref:Uncharacterized protein n=1 Tax=Protopolystoma xenopodis TaxID=117903 RepID=A0A448WL95_9PLAT|nr:unnamed protein product [Protopolystoma xenopodis]
MTELRNPVRLVTIEVVGNLYSDTLFHLSPSSAIIGQPRFSQAEYTVHVDEGLPANTPLLRPCVYSPGLGLRYTCPSNPQPTSAPSSLVDEAVGVSSVRKLTIADQVEGLVDEADAFEFFLEEEEVAATDEEIVEEGEDNLGQDDRGGEDQFLNGYESADPAEWRGSSWLTRVGPRSGSPRALFTSPGLGTAAAGPAVRMAGQRGNFQVDLSTGLVSTLLPLDFYSSREHRIRLKAIPKVAPELFIACR